MDNKEIESKVIVKELTEHVDNFVKKLNAYRNEYNLKDTDYIGFFDYEELVKNINKDLSGTEIIKIRQEFVWSKQLQKLICSSTKFFIHISDDALLSYNSLTDMKPIHEYFNKKYNAKYAHLIYNKETNRLEFNITFPYIDKGFDEQMDIESTSKEVNLYCYDINNVIPPQPNRNSDKPITTNEYIKIMFEQLEKERKIYGPLRQKSA